MATAPHLLDPAEEKACLEKVLWPSHEPLLFMRRRGGLAHTYAEYYENYHRPENVTLWAKLLGPGGMQRLHFFKGMGLAVEREEIERTVAVAKRMHAEGLRVSVYIGGTMHTDWFYKEVPEAREWACVAADGSPITYMGYQLWRHFACINNPDYRRYVRRVLDVALDEVGADEIFFDNQILRAEPRSCRCKVCRELFPRRVERKYTAAQRTVRFGHPDVSGIQPPQWSESWPPGGLREIRDPVLQEWIDFRCETVYDFFRNMKDHIQSKKPATAVGMNIKGLHAHNMLFNNGIDHGRWQESGFNCCDAGLHARVGRHKNVLGEFRAYKITHTTGLSQSGQQGDLDNLLCMVMNRQLEVPGFGRRPTMGEMRTFGPLGRFMRRHEADLYGTRPIFADVAVLRSFPSMAYHSLNCLYGPQICEQGLWEARIPFGIIFDQNMGDLSAYRVILLANQDALSDANVERLQAFVEAGGGLVATEQTGALDEGRCARRENALRTAFGLAPGAKAARKAHGAGRVAYVPRVVPRVTTPDDQFRHPHGAHEDVAAPKNWQELEDALRWAAGGRFCYEVRAPLGVVAEYRQGPGARDRAVHLINVRGRPLRGAIAVSVAVEGAADWKLEVLSPEPLPRKAPELKRKDGRLAFALPGLGVYTVCVLKGVGK